MTYAKITTEGDIQCPTCKAEIITPSGRNPNNGHVEKMIVFPFTECKCPCCGNHFMLDKEEAQSHNSYWYPLDNST